MVIRAWESIFTPKNWERYFDWSPFWDEASSFFMPKVEFGELQE